MTAAPVEGRPLVSVIMNCFNGAAYLAEALESVRRQTYTHWELIFWDNQSTDRSAEILRSYQDSRFHYHYAPQHALLYESRNYAIRHARGELLAFLDVDDWWSAEKLERQVPLFANPEVGMVCSNYWVVNERKGTRRIRYRQILPTGWVVSELLANYYVGLLTLMVRASALASLPYPCDPRLHMIGDLDLVVRMALTWRLECAQEPLAFYRLHGNNESLGRRARHVEELRLWLAEAARNPALSESPGWKVLQDEYRYLAATDLLDQGKRGESWALWRHMRWGQYKIRLAIGFLLSRRWRQLLRN